jgi:glycerophosphoryl diester phosphodiesterase
MVCGHRGALFKSLENTRHSIQTAHELGCDEVEIDVFLLKCGTLVVFHGSGTDQNPGLLDEYSSYSSTSSNTSSNTSSSEMKGSVLNYTYQELQENFKFNPYYNEFGCGSNIIHQLTKQKECYIPTLENVLLDAKQNGTTLKIELKGPNTEEPTLALVEELDMVSQIHYSSFELSRIRKIRELRPQRDRVTGEHVYKTGALFDHVPDDFIKLSKDVDASEVHLKYSDCTKNRVEMIHDAGMDSMCWFRGPVGMVEDVTTKYHDVGNEDEVMFRTVMATGVKKMCVNKVDVLIDMLR